MAIDPNILLGFKGPQFNNPLEVAGQAMSLKRVAQENAKLEKESSENATTQQILKKNVVTGADGKTSLNKGATLRDLYQANPAKAMEWQRTMETTELESLERTTKAAKTLAWQANPENYTAVRQKAIEMQLPNAEKLPEMYSPEFVKNWQMGTLNGEEQVAQMWKQRDDVYKANEDKRSETKMGFEKQRLAAEQKRLGLEAQRVDISRMEAKNKAASGESLPLDKKKMVEAFSGKNANKLSIKNQIDSVVASWDSWDEKQQIAMGGQLLKTLNSPEGADAIGVEEAKRLGSKLQFAMGNITNGNPTQWGRDLPGFKVQAQNTAKTIGDAVGSNQKLVDEMMGRTSANKPGWAK